jgi:rod shape-determining protein MreD
MRYVAVIPVCYAAACLQTALAEAVTIGRIAPDLLALVAAVIALVVGGNAGLGLVAAVGLIEDLLSSGRLGIATATYLLAGWAAIELAEHVDPRQLHWRVLASGLFAAAVACGVGLARSAIGEPSAGLFRVVGGGLGVGIYTAGLAVPAWLAIGWIERWGNRRIAAYDM